MKGVYNSMSIEVLGILASVIVLISFTMPNEKLIRMTNIIGAILFVIYGIFVNAFSVWFLNGILCFVHIYKLLKK